MNVYILSGTSHTLSSVGFGFRGCGSSPPLHSRLADSQMVMDGSHITLNTGGGKREERKKGKACSLPIDKNHSWRRNKKTGGGGGKKEHESEIKTEKWGRKKNVLPKVTTGEKGVWVSPVGIISKKILLS